MSGPPQTSNATVAVAAAGGAIVALVVVALFIFLFSGGDDDTAGRSNAPGAAGASFRFLGFSDRSNADNTPPAELVPPDGTMRVCNPSSLYAFINFSNLLPPKQFAGAWTLNGQPLSQRSFNQTEISGTTFWEVQNTPTPLTPGAYRFQLTVDSAIVSQAGFTLAC